VIAENNPAEQEKSIKSNSLLGNCGGPSRRAMPAGCR
jgi:hypothetical protein